MIKNDNGIKDGKKTVYFLGDSLTARCDLNRFYPEYETFNFGISGDTLEEFVARCEYRSFANEPDAVVFLMGINDLNYGDIKITGLQLYFKMMLSEWKKNHPQMKIIVQSLYPVIWKGKTKYPMADRISEAVKCVNAALKCICESLGCRFVDIYPLLEKDGQLDLSYAEDCIHINDAGYEVVAKCVNSALEEIFNEG